MKYVNNETAQLRDQVVGRDEHGRPVAGQVLDISKDGNRILVSPAIQVATWVPTSTCVPVSVFEEKPEPAPIEQAAEPDKVIPLPPSPEAAAEKSAEGEPAPAAPATETLPPVPETKPPVSETKEVVSGTNEPLPATEPNAS